MAEENPPEGETPPEESKSPEKSKKKTFLMLGIAVVLLMAVGGGTLFFLSGGGDAQKPADAGVQTESEEKSSDQNQDAETKEKPDQISDTDGTPKKAPTLQEKLDSKKEESQEDAFGKTYSLKPFQVNLGNPLENRYIRLEVTVEYRGGEEQKQEIEKRRPQLRDAVLSIVSRKTREFLLAPDGKDQLRKELLIRINRYMTKPIDAVFLTDMLIE